MIICPSTAIDDARLVAERLRHLVESHQIEIPGDSEGRAAIWITISIGIASLSDSVDAGDKLIQAADRALYRAKQEGRNRVVSARSEIMGNAAAGVPIGGVAQKKPGVS